MLGFLHDSIYIFYIRVFVQTKSAQKNKTKNVKQRIRSLSLDSASSSPAPRLSNQSLVCKVNARNAIAPSKCVPCTCKQTAERIMKKIAKKSNEIEKFG
jgi:hypothetical protein